MKLKIDWVKIKLFFFYLLRWPEKLSPPVKSKIVKRYKKSLLGQAYYFCDLQNWKVKSPLSGTINQIYPNYAIQIVNSYGLQILINIQIDKENPMPADKVFQCQVSTGQKVTSSTTLFIIYYQEQVIGVTVYVLWQPKLLREISHFEKNNSQSFVKIYYGNPYIKKLYNRNHGQY